MVNLKHYKNDQAIIIEERSFLRWLFSNVNSAWIWLVLRLYLGYTLFSSGLMKVLADDWVGDDAGVAIKGLMGRAIALARDGDVAGWYAVFLENTVIPNAVFFSYVVAFGELLIGIGLIIGLLTGIAAFFGVLLKISFLLAGTINLNPFMFITAILLIVAWKVAGWYGLDRWTLACLGAYQRVEETG